MKTSAERIKSIIEHNEDLHEGFKRERHLALYNLEQKRYKNIEGIKENLKKEIGVDVTLYKWEDDRTDDEKVEYTDVRFDGEFDLGDDEYDEFSLWCRIEDGQIFVTETTSNYF